MSHLSRYQQRALYGVVLDGINRLASAGVEPRRAVEPLHALLAARPGAYASQPLTDAEVAAIVRDLRNEERAG